MARGKVNSCRAVIMRRVGGSPGSCARVLPQQEPSATKPSSAFPISHSGLTFQQLPLRAGFTSSLRGAGAVQLGTGSAMEQGTAGPARCSVARHGWHGAHRHGQRGAAWHGRTSVVQHGTAVTGATQHRQHRAAWHGIAGTMWQSRCSTALASQRGTARCIPAWHGRLDATQRGAGRRGERRAVWRSAAGDSCSTAWCNPTRRDAAWHSVVQPGTARPLQRSTARPARCSTAGSPPSPCCSPATRWSLCQGTATGTRMSPGCCWLPPASAPCTSQPGSLACLALGITPPWWG